MAKPTSTHKALSLLLPIGVLGASALLASTQAQAKSAESLAAVDTATVTSVASRLLAIRQGTTGPQASVDRASPGDLDVQLAWLNFGGGFGWRNGGWGNGGWGNGWHNGGWGNGGWHNGGWGNGWHNGGWGNGGWGNGWHNG